MRTRSPTPTANTRVQALRIIAKGSKSFALASRVLPEQQRIDAALVYAWCRRVDDAIDEAPPEHRALALTRMRQELSALYDHARPLSDPLWFSLREVVERRRIPEAHFATLLDGMQMDVEGKTYQTMDELLLYCHRVAGVVGWLMVGVLGVSDRNALRPAAHLGIAMQLTNIGRDVVEDWENRRLYLPNDLLTRHGISDLHRRLGSPFPRQEYQKIGAAVGELLTLADRFYAQGDQGLLALSIRSAFAIRTARLVYAAIGDRIRAVHCDVLAGRAVVPIGHKLKLLGRALAQTVVELPQRLSHPYVELVFEKPATFPDDLLPW